MPDTVKRPMLHWYAHRYPDRREWAWHIQTRGVILVVADGYDSRPSARRAARRWLQRYCAGCELKEMP